ncbi:MAG: NAD(P)H-hydrate epimerase [Candidatus Omnitrophica bacterium]|nr:NAD(P)H-hydrate epimerase [Candidatus Omnitrophota bacterium]HOX54674.1 NAD(P)H-hydrate epimerase [Candidatus Omnitrophota bacterium]
MIKQASAKQIQKLDNIAINKYKVDSLFLMENAGKAVAEEVLSILKKRKFKKIAVICGKGNNGGDGLVAARYLVSRGFEVKNFLIGKVKEITSDSRANLDILLNLNQNIFEILDIRTFNGYKKIIKDCEMVIDAIFGVGLKGEVKEPAKTIINFLNRSRKVVVSVDVPSGLDATSGLVLGACVKASSTVSFTLAKKGFFINDGPKFIGKLKVVDIGIPKNLMRAVKYATHC